MSRQITVMASFALLASLILEAQAQPPAVGSATLTLRYDASTQSYGNGASVDPWVADTGPNAAAESAGVTPTFQTDWSPSGLSGVVFDGVDDRLLIGTDPTGVNADAIFAVLQMNGTGAPEQQQIIGEAGAKVMGVRNGALFVVDEPAGTGFSDTSSLHVVSWVSGSPLQIDGVETGGDTVRTHTFTDLRIIGDERETPVDNPGPNMTFGELLTYTGTISSSERTEIQNYLTNKWVVPEPTTLALLSVSSLLLLLRRRSR